MPQFDPGGKARHLMEMLDQGSMTRAEIVSWAGQAFTKGDVKIPYVLVEIAREGWIRSSASGGYFLTATGAKALSRLRRGETLTTAPAKPNVRIFARAA